MSHDDSDQDDYRLRLAFVGHVDHGKSTLIGRLLAESGTVDPALLPDLSHATDNFDEERRGGLSMDTAQAYCRLGGRELVLIDVPGHRELLRNMMTGATRADAAVLVVAADEGAAEQTRRHASLLSLLGLGGAVVVAVNKIDAVDYSADRFDEVRAEVLALLDELSCPALAVVPVSAARGCNVAAPAADTPWYAGPTLVEALDEFQPPTPQTLPARFVVQDVYATEGKPVYTGRLLSGTMREGEHLLCFPQRDTATVNQIIRFPANRAPVQAGESAALSLRGAAAPMRGSVLAIAAGEPPAVSRALTARVFWWHSNPLGVGQRITVRCATQAIAGAIEHVAGSADGLREGDLADVTIALDAPIVTESFARVPALGRLVLERDGTTGGAGIVP